MSAREGIGSAEAVGHTPGPWVYRDMRERGTLGVAWVDAENFTHIAECHRIAHIVNGMPCHAPDGMAEANARLIAAAPNLLAVAKAYEQWEGDLILDSDAWRGSLPTISQAMWDRFVEIQDMRNAAISKASPDRTVSMKAGE